MYNIPQAQEKFAALIEAQKKRVAAMREQGDFVDYQSLNQLSSAFAAVTASARPLQKRHSVYSPSC